jgi:hypothetical protein
METFVRARGLPWYPPHVYIHNGVTTLEWWKGLHSLTIFVARDGSKEAVMYVGSPTCTIARIKTVFGAVELWRVFRSGQ